MCEPCGGHETCAQMSEVHHAGASAWYAWGAEMARPGVPSWVPRRHGRLFTLFFTWAHLRGVFPNILCHVGDDVDARSVVIKIPITDITVDQEPRV